MVAADVEAVFIGVTFAYDACSQVVAVGGRDVCFGFLESRCGGFWGGRLGMGESRCGMF